MTDDGWRSNMGVAADTSRVSIYCDAEHANVWATEADDRGRSRSAYLYELIEEARAYRQEGFFGWEASQERIEELEAEIERLNEMLDDETTEGRTPLHDPDSVKPHLASEYRSLDEIVQSFIGTEDLERVLRPAIEDALYLLIEQNEVEYQRGHGWRLVDGGGA